MMLYGWDLCRRFVQSSVDDCAAFPASVIRTGIQRERGNRDWDRASGVGDFDRVAFRTKWHQLREVRSENELEEILFPSC